MHGTNTNFLDRIERPLTTDDIDAIEHVWCLAAKDDFWKYRLLMNPGMLIGWWQQEVARELQQFYKDWVAGKCPKLVLQAPRQHGKSVQVIDFLAWIAGKVPEAKTIFGSFSDRLGIRANLRIQRAFGTSKYPKIFQNMQLAHNSVAQGRLRGSELNREIIEFPGYTGSFRNTTVGGRVNGESLDLGVVDDPIKGREEANSEVIREKTWDWFTDDFMGCFSKHAALLVICTRWHVDDPVGRMCEQLPGVKVLRYPAIAERDEKHRKKGEALFPEHKPIAWLNERRKVLSQAGFQAIYQQSPIVVGGGIFPIDRISIISTLPARKEIRRAVRYWDKGSTSGDGDFTAGVLMLETKDHQFIVADVRRKQWGALERERVIRQTAEIDRKLGYVLDIWVEQEPGSGGKESAESTIRNLRGFKIAADKVTGDKETRADPYAAQVQAGNVSMLVADWNRSYLDELEQFNNGKHDDQVDASSGAFNKLTLGSRYLSDLSWVG